MELFNTTAFCFTCHSIGRGKVIGPDLANVHERREGEWLVKFIKSSQAMVNSGDPEAVKIFNEFNKIPMPDPPGVSEADILSIIDFIKVASATPGQAPAASTAAAPTADGDADQGKKLFTGLVGLKNNGPTCIACHQVKDDKAITGGSLALELTLEYSTKGGAAFINNILSTTPFPAMKEAYGKRPLTKDEVADLTAYLKRVDEQHQQQQGRNYGTTLFFSGLLGAVILIVVFPMLWSRRRRGSVNRKIYDRQIKSTN
jgi:cytochrome c2